MSARQTVELFRTRANCAARMRALPIHAFNFRRSRRDLTARGSVTDISSSHSFSRRRFICSQSGLWLKTSTDLEQGAMAAEPGAKGTHPPIPGSLFCSQGGLQHKINRGAAQIAVLRQHGGTVVEVLVGQLQARTQAQEDIAPTRVQYPSTD